MKLADIKAQLVGKTIADIDLSIEPNLSAVLVHGVTFEDGSTVSFEGYETGQVWLDNTTDAEGNYLDVSPDAEELDAIHEADEAEHLEREGQETARLAEIEANKVFLRDVVTDEERVIMVAGLTFRDSCDRMLNAEILATHEYDPTTKTGDKYPVMDPHSSCVTKWWELQISEERKALIGFGVNPWKRGEVVVFQATHRSTFGRNAGGDEWTRIATF